MATSPCKGTTLKIDIATVLTPVAQLIEITPSQKQSTDFEVVSLDQADRVVHREPDGYINVGPTSGVLFWDPENAAQAALLTHLDAATKPTMQILWPNTGASEEDFVASSVSLQKQVSARDGLKQQFSLNVDGDVTLTV